MSAALLRPERVFFSSSFFQSGGETNNNLSSDGKISLIVCFLKKKNSEKYQKKIKQKKATRHFIISFQVAYLNCCLIMTVLGTLVALMTMDTPLPLLTCFHGPPVHKSDVALLSFTDPPFYFLILTHHPTLLKHHV